VLVVLVGVLVVLALISEDRTASVPDELGAAVTPVMPTADDAGALSSTWYCAAGTAIEGGAANLIVVVANPLRQARRGTVTWYPGADEPVVEEIQVGPQDTLSLTASASLTAPVVSAVVEVEGGGVGVEHGVSGPRGADASPCASAPSDRWHFANGSTTRDARQALFLFNPFPDDVIVDISFATEQLREEPVGLQGLPLAPGTSTVVDVGAFVRRREVTATTVTARSGRLVVDRVQTFDGTEGRSGLSLALGAPTVAEVWHFPDGLHDEALAQRWHVYNPGEDEAVVLLEIVPDEGDAPEPVERTIPPRSQVIIDAATNTAVPAGVAHASTVRSINGVGVVAEREVDARPGAARRGWTSSLGSPREADRWLLAVGQTSSTIDQYVVVSNPSADDVTFSVVALAGGRVVEVEGLQDIALGPAERRAIRMGDRIERSPLPLVVEASGPVVVERDLYRVSGVGISVARGIPLP
jgi:hypothetical protein